MAGLIDTPLKIQLLGHSFVTRLKQFIQTHEDLSFTFNLRPREYLVQFSGFPGACVEDLLKNLEVVSDFHPDIVILLIGTIDLYNYGPVVTAEKIKDFAAILHNRLHIKYVCVGQILYRSIPHQPTRFRSTLMFLTIKLIFSIIFFGSISGTNLHPVYGVLEDFSPRQTAFCATSGWSPPIRFGPS